MNTYKVRDHTTKEKLPLIKDLFLVNTPNCLLCCFAITGNLSWSRRHFAQRENVNVNICMVIMFFLLTLVFALVTVSNEATVLSLSMSFNSHSYAIPHFFHGVAPIEFSKKNAFKMVLNIAQQCYWLTWSDSYRIKFYVSAKSLWLSTFSKKIYISPCNLCGQERNWKKLEIASRYYMKWRKHTLHGEKPVISKRFHKFDLQLIDEAKLSLGKSFFIICVFSLKSWPI